MGSIFKKLNKSFKHHTHIKNAFLHKPSFKGFAKILVSGEAETQKYFSGSHVFFNNLAKTGSFGQTLQGVHNGLNMAVGSFFTYGLSTVARQGLNQLANGTPKTPDIVLDLGGGTGGGGTPGGQLYVGENGGGGSSGGFFGGGLAAAGNELREELGGNKAPIALGIIAAAAVVLIIVLRRK